MFKQRKLEVLLILHAIAFVKANGLNALFAKNVKMINVNESDKIHIVSQKICFSFVKCVVKVALHYCSETKQNTIFKTFSQKVFKRNTKRYDYDILSTISKLAKLLIDRYNQKILINSEELGEINRLQIKNKNKKNCFTLFK